MNMMRAEFTDAESGRKIATSGNSLENLTITRDDRDGLIRISDAMGNTKAVRETIGQVLEIIGEAGRMA